MTSTSQNPLSADAQHLLQDWFHLWGVEELAGKVRIEISSRMTRSLGRCYADRRLIRIAKFVSEESDELLHEVLCHEAAHVAAYHLHGRSIRPHGPEWKMLVKKAGYAPSVRFKGQLLSSRPFTRARRRTFLGTLGESLNELLRTRTRSAAFKKRRPQARPMSK